jgi:hypothetical protein
MQQQQDKLDRKSTTLSRKEEALFVDSGNDIRALVLKWFVRGGKINSTVIQKLYGNKKGQKAKSIRGETAARMSILNNKTGKSIDGIAHNIWENRAKDVEFTTMDVVKEIETVVGEFAGVSKMVDELLRKYGLSEQTGKQTEETEEEKRIRENKEADEQEQYEYRQALNLYWESEGPKINQAFLDFEASTLGQILNGTYKGTREELTNDVERRTYDQIFSDTEEQKTDATETEDYFGPKQELDPIVKKVREYDTNNILGINSVQKVGTMFNLITSNSNFEDLVYIYLSLYSTNIGYSDAQKNSVIRSITSRFASFNKLILNPSRTIRLNEFTATNGNLISAGVYEITPIQTNSEQLVRFGLKNQLTNEIFEIEGISELFLNIADIYEPGSTINTNPINLSLNNNDVEIIKASFTDFFSNFNNSMSDVQNLEEEDLRSQITEQFKTCK